MWYRIGTYIYLYICIMGPRLGTNALVSTKRMHSCKCHYMYVLFTDPARIHETSTLQGYQENRNFAEMHAL